MCLSKIRLLDRQALADRQAVTESQALNARQVLAGKTGPRCEVQTWYKDGVFANDTITLDF